MSDTRYLQKRGKSWYIRIPHPPAEWGVNGEFVASLDTADLIAARGLRDRYLMPLLGATKAKRFLTTLADLAAAADAEVADRLRELRPGLTGNGREPLTLRKGADAFLSYLRASGGHSAATLAQYESTLDGVCRLLGDDADAAKISKTDVAEMRDTLLTLPSAWQRMDGPPRPAVKGESKLSPRTATRYLTYGRRLFRWLRDEGKVARTDNPFQGITVAHAKQNGTAKAVATPEQVKRLFNLPKPKRIGGRTWRLLPRLARLSGLRIGELCQLRGADVQERDGVPVLVVTARGDNKSLKTRSSERLVPIHATLVAELRKLAEAAGSALVFPDVGTYRDKRGLTKWGHEFLKCYNRRSKKVGDGLSFHAWRTYFNSTLASAGVDLVDRQLLLGHASSLVIAAYQPADLQRLQKAVNSLQA